jgi:hypothetical protein
MALLTQCYLLIGRKDIGKRILSVSRRTISKLEAEYRKAEMLAVVCALA